VAKLEVSLTDLPFDRLQDADFENMRHAFPSARALPLLRLLAMRAGGGAVLEYLDVSGLQVRVEPCA
jgi:hypothetical protein